MLRPKARLFNFLSGCLFRDHIILYILSSINPSTQPIIRSYFRFYIDKAIRKVLFLPIFFQKGLMKVLFLVKT